MAQYFLIGSACTSDEGADRLQEQLALQVFFSSPVLNWVFNRKHHVLYSI